MESFRRRRLLITQKPSGCDGDAQDRKNVYWDRLLCHFRRGQVLDLGWGSAMGTRLGLRRWEGSGPGTRWEPGGPLLGSGRWLRASLFCGKEAETRGGGASREALR